MEDKNRLIKGFKFLGFIFLIIPISYVIAELPVKNLEHVYTGSVSNVHFDTVENCFRHQNIAVEFSFFLEIQRLKSKDENIKDLKGLLTYPPIRYDKQRKCIKSYIFLASSDDKFNYTIMDTLAITAPYELFKIKFKESGNLYLILYSKGCNAVALQTTGFNKIE